MKKNGKLKRKSNTEIVKQLLELIKNVSKIQPTISKSEINLESL